MLELEGEDRSADAAAIAATVKDFYERHPYPGPAETLQPTKASDADKRAEYHLLWPARPFREDHSILIAGCGTVQAAKHAMRWPQAHVVGIDVSEASLRHSAVLKEKYGLRNLELRHLAIEDLALTGDRFDRIVCTGVLHHLPDPNAGLRALRTALTPDGRLNLMVYAPYGRAGIYLIQQYNRLIGTGSAPKDISDLVSTLKQLPKGHPLWPLLSSSPDFRYDAGIADALLHPQDRPYSVPQFLDFLNGNGLRFGRWVRQAPYLPYCGSARHTPHFARLAKLDLPGQYAAMELFRGTMVRHSAIAFRDDGQPDEWQPGFQGDHCLEYRPVRLPGAICIEERLPPGKAGVLLNRSHTDTDIYMPIDAEEKRLVEAIDGTLQVRDLMKRHRSPAFVLDLLGRLWQHDQILIDASTRSSSRL